MLLGQTNKLKTYRCYTLQRQNRQSKVIPFPTAISSSLESLTWLSEISLSLSSEKLEKTSLAFSSNTRRVTSWIGIHADAIFKGRELYMLNFWAKKPANLSENSEKNRFEGRNVT